MSINGIQLIFIVMSGVSAITAAAVPANYRHDFILMSIWFVVMALNFKGKE